MHFNIFPLRAFGETTSLAQRQRLRLDQYFESPEETSARVQNQETMVRDGIRRAKRHGKSAVLPSWDVAGCSNEVQSLVDGTLVSFSGLARKYNFVNEKGELPANAGQTVRETLDTLGNRGQ